MSLGAHLQELEKKHANLAARVEEAERSPGINSLDLRNMKKEKLRLKEEIERLQH